MSRDTILSLVPSEHFILNDVDVRGEKRPPLAQRDTRRIVLYLERRVIGPFINRQDMDTDTIRAEAGGIQRIRVPARKWKSVEKVRAVQICRAYGVISPDYLYNEVNATDLLANPASVVFGDSAAGSGDSAGIPSLAIYEQGLSVQAAADSTERLTHNALSEAGTMMNVSPEKKGEFRQSLYETTYIKEGTVFLQSITLEAPTPEALGLVLMVLDQTRYGAGKQVLGSNVQNTVLGLLATRNEPPVTAYTVLDALGEGQDVDKAKELYLREAREWGGHWVDGARVEALRAEIRKDAPGRERMMRNLGAAAHAYHAFVYGVKEKADKPKVEKPKKAGRGKAAAGEESE